MFRNVITNVVLLSSILGFGQSISAKGMIVKETIKIENVAVTVTVDSAEELESTFKLDDIKELIEDAGKNETFTFKIICNGKPMSNGVKSHISYKVEGDSEDIDSFFKSVETIRSAAINYYNSKK